MDTGHSIKEIPDNKKKKNMSIVLLILFLIAVIVGAVRGEYKTSTYWFLTLLSLVAITMGGGLGILGL